jgi:hypothetical protein
MQERNYKQLTDLLFERFKTVYIRTVCFVMNIEIGTCNESWINKDNLIETALLGVNADITKLNF